jgi:ketosteroid isomerase-like protein
MDSTVSTTYGDHVIVTEHAIIHVERRSEEERRQASWLMLTLGGVLGALVAAVADRVGMPGGPLTPVVRRPDRGTSGSCGLSFTEDAMKIPSMAAAALAALLLQTSAKPSGVEADVLALEAKRVQAMLSADLATLESILAEDLSYSHSSGKVETKAEFIESVRSGRLKYRSFERSDVKVRIYGDAAVVTGRADVKVQSSGEELALPIRYLDVYVKTRGTWRMVAWQSTRLAPAN